MGYKVGIYDKDTNYVRNVMEYINHYGKASLRIAAFSNIESLKSYIDDNFLDLIILGEQVKLNKDVPVVFICDRRDMMTKEKIYKYQDGEEIISQILKIIKNNEVLNQNHSLIYGIYSPVGRCGKTTLSLGICNHYKKALYIGLEEYSGFSDEYSYLYETGEKFKYYLANKNKQVFDLLDNVAETSKGFKVIVADGFFDGDTQQTHKNIAWLCNELRIRGLYHRVVFDIGVGSLGDVKELEIFDRIYIPVLRDKISSMKLNRFKEIIELQELKDLMKKFVYVEVPESDYDAEKISLLIQEGNL